MFLVSKRRKSERVYRKKNNFDHWKVKLHLLVSHYHVVVAFG